MFHFLLFTVIKVNIVQNFWLFSTFSFVKKASGHFSVPFFLFQVTVIFSQQKCLVKNTFKRYLSYCTEN